MPDIRQSITLVNSLLRLSEGRDDDDDHQDALDRTGFWGARGAGCLLLAKSTGRFLIAHRSMSVEQPGDWGTFGGAIDSGEDLEEAVRREVHEECGYGGAMELIPLYVFKKGSFRYHNFLAVIPDEFVPRLNWENQGYIWAEWGKWPRPLHFGFQAILADAKSAATMKSVADQAKGLR